MFNASANFRLDLIRGSEKEQLTDMRGEIRVNWFPCRTVDTSSTNKSIQNQGGIYPGDIFIESDKTAYYVVQNLEQNPRPELDLAKFTGGQTSEQLVVPSENELDSFIEHTSKIASCLGYHKNLLAKSSGVLHILIVRVHDTEIIPTEEEYVCWWEVSHPDAFSFELTHPGSAQTGYIEIDSLAEFGRKVKSKQFHHKFAALIQLINENPALETSLETMVKQAKTTAERRFDDTEHIKKEGEFAPHRVSADIPRPNQSAPIRLGNRELRAGDCVVVPREFSDVNELLGIDAPQETDDGQQCFVAFRSKGEVVNHCEFFGFEHQEKTELVKSDIRRLFQTVESGSGYHLKKLSRGARVNVVGKNAPENFNVHIYEIEQLGSAEQLQSTFLLGYSRHGIDDVLLEHPLHIETVGADSLDRLVKMLKNPLTDTQTPDKLQTLAKEASEMVDICETAADKAVEMQQIRAERATPPSPDNE